MIPRSLGRAGVCLETCAACPTKQVLSHTETQLLALVSALTCLSWLGWPEFVQSSRFISA